MKAQLDGVVDPKPVYVGFQFQISVYLSIPIRGNKTMVGHVESIRL
jgi:hypothetical protein